MGENQDRVACCHAHNSHKLVRKIPNTELSCCVVGSIRPPVLYRNTEYPPSGPFLYSDMVKLVGSKEDDGLSLVYMAARLRPEEGLGEPPELIQRAAETNPETERQRASTPDMIANGQRLSTPSPEQGDERVGDFGETLTSTFSSGHSKRPAVAVTPETASTEDQASERTATSTPSPDAQEAADSSLPPAVVAYLKRLHGDAYLEHAHGNNAIRGGVLTPEAIGPSGADALAASKPTRGVPVAASLPPNAKSTTPSTTQVSRRVEYGRPKKKRRKKVKPEYVDEVDHFGNSNPNYIKGLIDQAEALPGQEEFMNIAFCCFTCNCDEETRDKYAIIAAEEGESVALVHSDDGHVWHRRCCHKVRKGRTKGWKAGFLVAADKVCDNLLRDRTGALMQDSDSEYYSYRTYRKVDIQSELDRAATQEKKLLNDADLPHPIDVQYTNEDYVLDTVNPFKMRIKEGPEDHRCTLLALFAGIATELVTLKRLCIDIKKAIYCEHDKVATHVYRHNHDREYNPFLSACDDIEHVLFPTFEDFSENFNAFMEEHGPIDLILGGPPCVDYSGVNAYRKGVRGTQGNYMMEFSRTVRRIEAHPAQKGRKIFFLAENVILRGDDVEAVSDAFGMPPLSLDSSCFSPCTRKRMYWTNVALQNFDHVFKNEETSPILPSSCLFDDCIAGGSILNSGTRTKTLTFMASQGKIDDHRMRVYRANPHGAYPKFVGRLMNAEERGRMMGFPDKYVVGALEPLFTALLAGLSYNQEEFDTHWLCAVPEKFHHFSGEKFRFSSEGSQVALKIAPPLATETLSFFDQESYAKRLFGNAWNVPTIEEILRPLQLIFGRRTYTGYDYSFKWEGAQAVQLQWGAPEELDDDDDDDHSM